MLVLARKLDETIRIGDQITVTVLQVKGRIVKIGITAPRDVRVMRGELIERPEDGNSTVHIEATLDMDQLGTLASSPADAAAEMANGDSDSLASGERDDAEKRPAAERGLAAFRRNRGDRTKSGRPVVAGVLAAAN